MTFAILALPSLAALAANIAIGVYVLRRKNYNSVSRYFAVWMAFFAVWSFGEAQAISTDDVAGTLFWAKLMFVGIFLMLPAYASFVFKLVGKEFNIAFLYAPFVLLALTLPTDYFIAGLSSPGPGYVIGGHVSYSLVFNETFYIFAAAFLLLASYIIYTLYTYMRKVEYKPARKRLSLMLYPMVAVLSVAVVSDQILDMAGIYLCATGSVFTVLIALSTAYAFVSKG